MPTMFRKTTVGARLLLLMGGLMLPVFMLPAAGAWAAASQRTAKLNVLFIVVDDMNDWTTLFDTKNPIRTPNLERLAAKGLFFSRAYCSSAACNPSRTSVLTGLRPSTSGVYGNRSDWRKAVGNAEVIPQFFKNRGYYVAGAGKVFHHHNAGAFEDLSGFDDYQTLARPVPDSPMPEEKLNHLPKYGSPNTDWGVWPKDVSRHVDVKTADYAIRQLRKKHDQPFFLAVGIFRPHMPFFCPQEFFDKYPKQSVVMPELKKDDLDDVPSGGKELLARNKLWQGMVEAEKTIPGSWRDAVRGYQAVSTFADAQVGRVLDALEASPHAGNTIIILWSDNGYHLGEKENWEKFHMWEKTNHVPLVIVVPGCTTPGSICEHPVELIHLYPTLADLCGFSANPRWDGHSLRPLLEDPRSPWPYPAIMTYEHRNNAVRTRDWRYIRYADGTEELYDHRGEDPDPNEWNNLAGRPQYAETIAALRSHLPRKDAAPCSDLKAAKSGR